MTSEVALLNKYCIALAADSATTVTYWDKGEEKTRYFKGANKIFNLSASRPVGLMTYAAASLQGVPWEVIAKGYRVSLSDKGYDQLTEYATDFFKYIAGNMDMFPMAIQEKQFLIQVDRVASKIATAAFASEAYRAAGSDDEKAVAFTAIANERISNVSTATFIGGAEQTHADSATSKFRQQAIEMLTEDKWYDLVPRLFIPTLAEAAILGVYKETFTSLEGTGLAFAGYGDKEFFPRMFVYKCSGMVLGELLCAKEKESVISQENASDLVSLAISEMIDTFSWGVGDSVILDIVASFRTQSTTLIQSLVDAGHLSATLDVSAFLQTASLAHSKQLVGKLHENHRLPLTRVITSLPVQELAELAETLVFMESMKERVTTPSESVSGPIDVAVISKGDGFVWIKRKHYFDPKLNPRFFARRGVR